MKIKLEKIWLSSYDFIKKHPVVLTPFIVISFLECLILEAAYFCTRNPLLIILRPIVRKFFGEQFLHYPENLVLMPRLFNFGQLALYILVNVFITGMAIQIFLNIKNSTPVIFKAIVRATAKKYMALFLYGLIYVIAILILQKVEGFVFLNTIGFISRHLFKVPVKLVMIGSSLLFFFTSTVLNVFLILVIPVIVIEKKQFIGAILRSMALGAGNFIKLFCLLLLPLIFYLPILMMKAFLVAIMNKTFPEVSLYVMLLGIVIAVFIDCFIAISTAQFLLDAKED
ncbi:MAG: hypothetical protein V1927_03625 [Candidatus Omnitrophota bacterium]